MEKKTDGVFFKWNVHNEIIQKRFAALTPEKLFMFEN